MDSFIIIVEEKKDFLKSIEHGAQNYSPAILDTELSEGSLFISTKEGYCRFKHSSTVFEDFEDEEKRLIMSNMNSPMFYICVCTNFLLLKIVLEISASITPNIMIDNNQGSFLSLDNVQRLNSFNEFYERLAVDCSRKVKHKGEP